MQGARAHGESEESISAILKKYGLPPLPSRAPAQAVAPAAPSPADAAAQPVAPQPKANAETALAGARDAIAKGAPRDAVIERLKQRGYDPSGL